MWVRWPVTRARVSGDRSYSSRSAARVRSALSSMFQGSRESRADPRAERTEPMTSSWAPGVVVRGGAVSRKATQMTARVASATDRRAPTTSGVTAKARVANA